MPSAHLSLHYHLVFGTKNHEAMIQPRGARNFTLIYAFRRQSAEAW